MDLVFPTDRPDGNASRLWRLQLDLMREAEAALGQRDMSKQLCQPAFGNGGPVVVNTPNLDGAFARLSNNAAGYWPTAVYELAHETVHLLNPVVGMTNWFEEGVAVRFSVGISARTTHPMAPPVGDRYYKALTSVNELRPCILEVAGTIRAVYGKLSDVTPGILTKLFPNANADLLKRLCDRWSPRP
ncbi:MAG TPA: hypothetical protein VGG64_03710 [Pirellulales bacterium]|jgi:hypothetical protein